MMLYEQKMNHSLKKYAADKWKFFFFLQGGPCRYT